MAETDLILSDLSGGRNGVDSPVSDQFPMNQCVEAMNVDFRNGGLGRKRGGSKDVLTSATTGHTFTFPIVALDRHTPGDETEGEVWGWEDVIPGAISRLPPGTAWTPISGAAAVYNSQADIPKTTAVSFNGKMFSFFKDASGQNRLKVYDPSTNRIRFVGIYQGTNAPTAANTGVGAYAATIRYYRVRFSQISGSITVRMSEATPSVSFTPSGAGTAARVTRPTAPNEGETHWRLEFSPDNTNWYVASDIAIATTTFDDSTTVPNEPTFPISQLSGTFTLVPSAKFGCTDGNRLIFANWDISGLGSRVGWTQVLGSLDLGDDERMFQTATIKPYIDLDTKNGGDLTAIGVVNTVVYAFKMRQVWRGTPTDDISRPYSFRRITNTVGAVSHRSLAIGEDASGNACIYFQSAKGPYRIGVAGLEYLGRDIEDLTRTSAGKPNINTVATKVIAHSIFHADMGQWWLWFSTGSNNSPDQGLILDVKRATRRDAYGVRGGWSRLSGLPATAVCSCLGPHVFGSTANLRPWIGIPGNAAVLILDRDDLQDDAGTTFQAYVTTRSVGPFGQFLETKDSILIASHHTAAPVTIRQTVIRDFSLETFDQDITMAAADIDKTLVNKFSGSGSAGSAALQLRLGDSAAVSNAWELKLLKVPLTFGGDL